MSALADHCHLEAQRMKLTSARDRLAALDSVKWPGLVKRNFEPTPISAEIDAFRPWLANEVTLHGRMTPVTGETTAALLHRPTAAEPWRWQVQPYIIAWPFVPATVGNQSVLTRPFIRALPGWYLYLYALWDITPPSVGGFGRLACNKAELIASPDDSSDRNDYSAITGRTVRAWYQMIGAISHTGEYLPTGDFSANFAFYVPIFL